MPVADTFLASDATLAWLGQFEAKDQVAAEAMLRAMALVSGDTFRNRLRELVLHRMRRSAEPVGLYAERELHRQKGVPDRLFKETRTKKRRAFGLGPQPVRPTKGYDPEVGSEGLVAQLVTELCREHRGRLLNHPGPDAIRKNRIRRFIVLTDFIGSGRRARDYIQAAWRVRSVRSWWSLKLLRFEVLAYAATPDGRRHVEAHACKPSVYVVSGCPTIDTLPRQLRSQVQGMCIRYDPVDHDPVESLGFAGGGALIAFAHGVPNNAPRILHKRSSNWAPLFPARVTAGTRSHFDERHDAAAVAERLLGMRQRRLALGPWLHSASAQARALFLLLGALGHGPRTDEVLSRKTGLTILEIQRWLLVAAEQGWIDSNRRLTDQGYGELEHARRRGRLEKPLQPSREPFYYPNSLRAPSVSSS
jgi:hypothetical protein